MPYTKDALLEKMRTLRQAHKDKIIEVTDVIDILQKSLGEQYIFCDRDFLTSIPFDYFYLGSANFNKSKLDNSTFVGSDLGLATFEAAYLNRVEFTQAKNLRASQLASAKELRGAVARGDQENTAIITEACEENKERKKEKALIRRIFNFFKNKAVPVSQGLVSGLASASGRMLAPAPQHSASSLVNTDKFDSALNRGSMQFDNCSVNMVSSGVAGTPDNSVEAPPVRTGAVPTPDGFIDRIHFTEGNLPMDSSTTSTEVTSSASAASTAVSTPTPPTAVLVLKGVLNTSLANSQVLFCELAKKGFTWRLIKSTLLDPALSQTDRRTAKEILNTLIRHRDLYDAELYEQAVQTLFPSTYFCVSYVDKAVVKPDHSGIALKYYTLLVHNNMDVHPSHSREQRLSQPHISIEVIAPGSRDLTSDVDTTLNVSFGKNTNGSVSLAKANWANIPGLEPEQVADLDSEALVQLGMVHWFYELNKQAIGLSSGESRDSNVYGDGFTNRKVTDNFLKFPQLEYDFDPDLTKNLVREDFYKDAKQMKQQQELAGSLGFIYLYAQEKNPEVWQEFRGKVIDAWRNRFDHAELRASVQTSINVACELVEKICQDRQAAIEEQVPSITYAEPLSLLEEALNKDREVHSLNTLYVTRLVQVAKLRNQLARNREQLRMEVKKLQSTLGEEKEQLNAFNAMEEMRSNNPNNERMSKYREEARRELAEIRDNLKILRQQIIDLEGTFARLICEHQQAMILANLMANEAYINYSAPFHVVLGSQLGIGVKFNRRQVVLGSALQQIGFRLLHAQELLKQPTINVGEVAYLICKYTARLAELLFHEEAKQNIDKWLSSELPALMLPGLRPGFLQRTFQRDFYDFVSQELAVFRVKRSEGDYFEKPATCEANIRQAIYERKYPDAKLDTLPASVRQTLLASITQEEMVRYITKSNGLLLAFAADLIARTYESRLADSSKRQLWGGTKLTAEAWACLGRERQNLRDAASDQLPQVDGGAVTNFSPL